MKKILLTMGMPVFNEEKYIGEAIESLLAQTYKDFILIISDNASTDRTPQICQYYAKKDKRIVYIRHNENKGSLFNFRYVLEQANTPFFMWCSGHDKWHPSFVEKLLPELKKDDVLLSYPEMRKINIDGTPGEIYKNDFTTVNINNAIERYLYIIRGIDSANIIYGIWRTQALKNCDFDLETFAPDRVILAQTAIEGKFKQYPEPLFFLRERKKYIDYSERVREAFTSVTGQSIENKNIFLIIASFISANKKALFRKRYSFNIITKLWLMINIVYVCLFWFCVMPVLIKILKKLFPEKIYLKIKSIRNRRNTKN